MDPCWIRGITICYEDNLLFRPGSTNGLMYSDNRWQGISCPISVIRCDLTAFRGDKEEDKIVFASHFDVGFISSLNIVYFSLIGQIKPMAIGGNYFGVVIG